MKATQIFGMLGVFRIFYLCAIKQVQDKCDGTAVDADEEVDAGERDVRGAGHIKHV